MDTLLQTLRVIGFTLWAAGLWALAIVAVEHGQALSLGTSLRKFRILQRTLFRQLVLPGGLLYLATEVATQLAVTAAPLRLMHWLSVAAVGGVTLYASRAVATLATDPSQGHAANRLALVRPASLPVWMAGVALELWPLL